MSRGINKVILIGNLGQDPERRAMPNGTAVTSISIATSENWKDKNTGESKENTEWHRVIFFNKLAEIAADYLKKGSQVFVEGKLTTRKWQDKEGNDRYTTEIIANEMQMLGSKSGGDTSLSGQSSSANEYRDKQSRAPAVTARDPDTFEDDDIPF